MGQTIDRLLQTRKDGVFDEIDLGIERIRDALTGGWSLFDGAEQDALRDIERDLLTLRSRFRREIKAPRWRGGGVR